MTIRPPWLALSRLFIAFGILLISSITTIAQPTEEECQDIFEIPVCEPGENIILIDIEEEPTGVVTFTIDQLKATDTPESSDCPNGTEPFQLFWDFGDGQYACALDESSEVLASNGGPLVITHTYTHNGTFYPRLIVTKRYTNEDPPPLANIRIPIDEEIGSVIISGISESNDMEDMGDDCIRITPIHNAYFGEDIWLLLSFMYDGSDQVIEFDYDQGLESELFSYQSSVLYLPGYDGIPMESTSEGGSRKLKLPENLPNQVELLPGRYHIAIQLQTRYQLPEGEEELTYGFSASINPGPSQIPKSRPCTDMSHNFIGKSVGPKDPNEKTVDITLTNSPEPEILTYTISFYNDGQGQTDSVKVKDTISPLLDLCSVEMKKVVIDGVEIFPNTEEYHDSFEPDIDYDNRILFWAIAQSLHGLWENGAGYKHDEAEENGINHETDVEEVANFDKRTRMELVFFIQTSCSFDYGDIIENDADIQFDDLKWFTTSPATTEKVCCDTTMNTTFMQGTPVPILSLYDGTLTSIDTSSITTSFDSGIPTFDPATGIFKYSSSPDSLDRLVFSVCDSAGNCDTTVQYLCVYDSLIPGTVFQFPVCSTIPCEDTPCPPEEDPPTPAPSPIGWPVWGGILLGLIALIVFIITRRRSG